MEQSTLDLNQPAGPDAPHVTESCCKGSFSEDRDFQVQWRKTSLLISAAFDKTKRMMWRSRDAWALDKAAMTHSAEIFLARQAEPAMSHREAVDAVPRQKDRFSEAGVGGERGSRSWEQTIPESWQLGSNIKIFFGVSFRRWLKIELELYKASQV